MYRLCVSYRSCSSLRWKLFPTANDIKNTALMISAVNCRECGISSEMWKSSWSVCYYGNDMDIRRYLRMAPLFLVSLRDLTEGGEYHNTLYVGFWGMRGRCSVA